MHQEGAVTVEQNHRIAGPRGGDAHGVGDAVPDGAELADRQEGLLRPVHMGEEERTMAGGIDHLPVGRQAPRRGPRPRRAGRAGRAPARTPSCRRAPRRWPAPAGRNASLSRPEPSLPAPRPRDARRREDDGRRPPFPATGARGSVSIWRMRAFGKSLPLSALCCVRRQPSATTRSASAKSGAGESGREAARDTDRERIAVEKPPRGQRRGEQGSGLLSQRYGGVSRVRGNGAETAHDDDLFRLSNQFGGVLKVVREGRNGRGPRQDVLRRRRKVRHPVEHLGLKVEGHAQDDGTAHLFRLDEGIADRLGHAGNVVQRVIGRARRADERGLVDLLIVPRRPEGRFAREDDDGDARTNGRRKRRHHLRQARPASDGRDAHPARLPGIGGGGGYGAMLVTDIDHADATHGQRRGPVHVGVPQKGEAALHLFGDEGFSEMLVDVRAHRMFFDLNQGCARSGRIRAAPVRGAPAPAVGGSREGD